MRSLQRLTHSRPGGARDSIGEAPAGGGPQQGTIHRLETNAVRRRERRIWLRRMRGVGTALLVLAIAAVVLVVTSGSRIVADGLVRGNVVTMAAPGQVRVAEWLVDAGDHVRAGQPLVRVEDVVPTGERDVLAARVAAARAQLAWYDAGGETELMGADQRVDRVVEATRNEALARAQVRALSAAVDVAGSERDQAVATLDETRSRQIEAARAIDARRAGRVADIDRAQAEADLARRDQERARQLVDDGIQSRRELDAATTRAKATASTVEVLRSELDAIDAEAEANAVAGAATIARAERDVTVTESKLAEARTAVEAAVERADAWLAEVEHHRSLSLDGPVAPNSVRAARRARLAADVTVAEAALAAYDLTHGARTIVCESDGVIDEVLAVTGTIVETGAPLVRQREPASSQVVVYVHPSAAPNLEVGDSCSVRCEGFRRPAEGVVAAVGGVWIDAPDEVTPARGARSVAVTLELADGAPPFSANAHVKASFRTDPWTAARRRVLDWFGR